MKNRENIAKYIGEEYGGPILIPYVKWILDQALKGKISRLYFIARDGYVLKRIADIFIDSYEYPIQTYYIYGSRKTWRMGIFVQDDVDIIKLLDESYKERINSVTKLAKVFQVNEDDLKKFLPKGYHNVNRKLIIDDIFIIQNHLQKSKKFKCFLKKKHNDIAERATQYLRQEINVADNAFAFVELYGSGYTQNCMSLLMKPFYNETIITFFYYQHKKQKGNNIFLSFAEDTMDIKILIETLCRSLEGQTVDYYFSDYEWKPLIGKKELLKNYGYQRYVDGVMDYTKNFISNNLCIAYAEKWKQFFECKDYMVMNYIGDMPYGVVGSENKKTYFAPKLSLYEIFYAFVNGWEAVEQNLYTGAMFSYSLKRMDGIKGNIVKILLKNKYLKIIQKRNIGDRNNNRISQIDYFSNCSFVKGKRIVVYGAGKIGSHIVKKIIEEKNEKLVLWIDQNEKRESSYFPIQRPEAIVNAKYDYIILASVYREYLDSMLNKLREINVPENKIIW